MKRNILLLFLLTIMILFLLNCKLIFYGVEQGIGQFKLVYKARPIEEILNDKNFPDSLKKKLILIQEIKKFAFDSLGLKRSKNYTQVYDQHGKPIVWIVAASEKYKIKAYLWNFPVVGKLPYIGFFDENKAKKEGEKLKNEGFDVRVGTVSAWSTLGFFKDPILSNMLYRDEGDLAELNIHELTHATLFIKGDATFNENLAQFIGTEGAKYYLQLKYGKESKEYKEYVEGNKDDVKFAMHILRGANKLDSLYSTFKNGMNGAEKDTLKLHTIERIMTDLDTVSFYDKSFIKRYIINRKKFNNAFFVNYKTYHSDQNVFEKEFRGKFNSNFRAYLAYLKKKYNSV